MPEFVSVLQDPESETVVTVTKGHAESAGLDVLDQPALDDRGRPLGPREVVTTPSSTDTVDTILRDVGDDPVKAQAALDAENARSRPRTTLVQALTTITEEAPQ